MRARFANDQLEGYQNISLRDIGLISDNELSYIFCDMCISQSTQDSYKNDIALWVSKLRKGGTINIIGVDLRAICTNYLYTNIPDNINSVISTSNGLFTYKEVEGVLKDLGLSVESIDLKDLYYNIMAKR